jgi:hypothetical protein
MHDRRRSQLRTMIRNLPWSRLAGAAGLCAALLAAVLLFGASGSVRSTSRTWNFEDKRADPTELGFRLSSKQGGEWLLADHEGATGHRALVNRPGDPAAMAASAVVDDSVTRDFRASTRCKSARDRSRQACGLVFRFVNHANYYVARVDAGRNTVTLGVVVGGFERELRSVAAQVQPELWQEVGVVAQADYLLVSLNGQHVLSTHDPTFPGAGRVGMWAPADGEAYFDELSLSFLPAKQFHPSDLLPIFLRRKT